jgi:molybdenum cofactor guanylyltransferase
MQQRIAGLILAGGRGQRLGGQDKALLPLGGRPLIAHVINRLGPQVTPVAISANGDPDRLAAFGLPVLPDPVGGFPGPLGGVLAGLTWAQSLGVSALVTVSVDTPFLPHDLLERLWAGRGASGLALAASASECAAPPRLHPTCALWPVDLAPVIARAIAAGQLRIGQLARDNGAATVIFHGDPDPFFNINTPEDIARAEALG